MIPVKIPTNKHRADRYELGAEARPSQVGTPAWVRALAARPLRPAAAALQRMLPHQFTEEFIRDNGTYNLTEALCHEEEAVAYSGTYVPETFLFLKHVQYMVHILRHLLIVTCLYLLSCKMSVLRNGL